MALLSVLTSLSLTTQTVLVATVIFFIVFKLTQKSYRLPPGPLALPLIGNFLNLLSGFENNMVKWKKKYGSAVTFYVGPKRVIMLNDIETVHEAFVKAGPAASGRPNLHSLKMLTEGGKDIFMASYGELWRFQRKLAVQAINHYIRGNQLEQRVHETIQPVIASMLEQEQPFNPKRHIDLAVFNVLTGICFGTVMQMNDPKFLSLMDGFNDILMDSATGFFEDYVTPLQSWPTSKFKKFLALANNFNSFLHSHWQEHKSDFDGENIRDLADSIILAKQQEDEKESSQISKQFTETHAVQTLADVFSAGVDASRQQLTWIFQIIAARPDIREKIHEEIDREVGAGVPSKEHRTKLVYVEAVMLEATRLYPVAPYGAPHEAMQDMSIGDFQIPKGTMLLPNQLEILRDPNHWDEPLEFKPERFLDESGTKIVPRKQSYIPFSLGNRVCLGESMSKLQMVYTIVGLMQKLTFSIPDGVTPDLTCNVTSLVNLPRDVDLIVKGR